MYGGKKNWKRANERGGVSGSAGRGPRVSGEEGRVRRRAQSSYRGSRPCRSTCRRRASAGWVPGYFGRDLVNTTEPYPGALPILLEHCNETIRKRCARVSHARWRYRTRSCWRTLVKLRTISTDERREVGCAALAAAADDEVIRDLIALFRDSRHGRKPCRYLSRRSTKSRNGEARLALENVARGPAGLSGDLAGSSTGRSATDDVRCTESSCERDKPASSDQETVRIHDFVLLLASRTHPCVQSRLELIHELLELLCREHSRANGNA